MGAGMSHIQCLTSIAGLSSIVMSMFPKLIANNPSVFRPLLNVSWGYLFGSTLWLCFFSEIGLVRRINAPKKKGLPENSEQAKELLKEIKNNEGDFKRRNIDFKYFFSLSTIFSSILLLSTVKLANHNLQLRICSTIVSLSCILNNIYFQNKIHSLALKKENLLKDMIDKPKDTTVLVNLKKNRTDFHIHHGLSLLLLYSSFFGLTPYIFT
ncbi:hypothetical protein YYC_01693 [Plasmodium yoelii 17X]|uniref:TMEM205-like domain-containing protein n=4 Tax=Plasmodium yoelii TaxID=5861 RepID=A0AAE9WVV7_PLAYO|nr:conserved protein, unknown function [Plasmodium yoelii]ETB61893.1 hypothetical protein YYC_01693 [Plasmodium yoelii 17X]WBY61177.1 hypothetical protein Py17XNL_001401375 [Plasmodium yoelii yoelii]CDU20892.1 conserved Plasmodium protein, unknown function [Plasmodium yoelii]VTZ81858.1 conserved protein, unknown function [Plasmodium yoelii]|eukprot:XP_723760.2 conserved protein, unknown function [Plasmodium yoelii]